MDQVVADLEDRGQRSINVKTEDFMNEWKDNALLHWFTLIAHILLYIDYSM
jgi:hypothetical protein